MWNDDDDFSVLSHSSTNKAGIPYTVPEENNHPVVPTFPTKQTNAITLYSSGLIFRENLLTKMMKKSHNNYFII